jgi:protoheme IX farnesyltransferase
LATKEAGHISIWAGLTAKIDDYKQLVKLRLNLLVVASAGLAYVIAAGTSTVLWDLWVLCLGGFLVTGASNALNQVLEKDYDRMMKRTANRPLPQGRISVSQAVLTAGWMSAAGIILLATLNPLTGMLGALSLLLYSFLYTPLKRVSPIAVVVGAIPGAMPTLIGCVAFQGGFTPLALLLFGLQFFWQFPHFWAIAELAKEDYRKAGFRIMPEGADAGSLGTQSLIYATLILPLVGGLYVFDYMGVFNTIFLSALTLVYMWLSYAFSKEKTRKAALRVMFASFFYLPLVLGALVVEQLL